MAAFACIHLRRVKPLVWITLQLRRCQRSRKNINAWTFNFQTDAAKRNYALVGVSVTVGLKENLYAQASYNAEAGRSNSTVKFVNAGLRYEF